MEDKKKEAQKENWDLSTRYGLQKNLLQLTHYFLTMTAMFIRLSLMMSHLNSVIRSSSHQVIMV